MNSTMSRICGWLRDIKGLVIHFGRKPESSRSCAQWNPESKRRRWRAHYGSHRKFAKQRDESNKKRKIEKITKKNVFLVFSKKDFWKRSFRVKLENPHQIYFIRFQLIESFDKFLFDVKKISWWQFEIIWVVEYLCSGSLTILVLPRPSTRA